MIISVTYQLSSPSSFNYEGFYNVLRNAATRGWWHYIDTQWLLDTDFTPEELLVKIGETINTGKDTVLINRVNLENYTGWLIPKAHDWIKTHR